MIRPWSQLPVSTNFLSPFHRRGKAESGRRLRCTHLQCRVFDIQPYIVLHKEKKKKREKKRNPPRFDPRTTNQTKRESHPMGLEGIQHRNFQAPRCSSIECKPLEHGSVTRLGRRVEGTGSVRPLWTDPQAVSAPLGHISARWSECYQN